MVGNGWEMVGVYPTYVLQAGAFLVCRTQVVFDALTCGDGHIFIDKADSEIRKDVGKPICFPIP